MVENILIYVKLFVVAIAGGLVGYIHKKSMNVKEKETGSDIMLVVITSIFIASIVYDGTVRWLDSIHERIALAGIASFIGIDLLLVAEKRLLKMIEKKTNCDTSKKE